MKTILPLILVAATFMECAVARLDWELTCARGEYAMCSGYCRCRPNGEVLCPSISVSNLPFLNTLCCNAAAKPCVSNGNCSCDLLNPPCARPSACKLRVEGSNTLWVDTKTGIKYCRHHETGDAAGIYTGSCLHYLDGKQHTIK